jgi:hypothetical protein
LPNAVQVMCTAGGKGIFYRNAVGSDNYMHFESVKVTLFGCAIAPVCFLFQYPVAWNADIVTNSYRKRTRLP